MEVAQDKALELYEKSLFYEKYKGKYASDKILKEVFGVGADIANLELKTYSQIYEYNVEVMDDFLNLFVKFARQSGVDDNDLFYRMIRAFYEDPDGFEIRRIGGADCSADGLLSLRRIYYKFGMSEATICEYRRYRKIPIFFFPREGGGINQSRSSVFGDRIDHTLFDLKRRLAGEEECKLSKAYDLPKTRQWIDRIETFENLAKIYDIEGIFVNEDYEVYDLEKDDGSIIKEYCDKYEKEWTPAYYNNLKKKIDEFMAGNRNGVRDIRRNRLWGI